MRKTLLTVPALMAVAPLRARQRDKNLYGPRSTPMRTAAAEEQRDVTQLHHHDNPFLAGEIYHAG